SAGCTARGLGLAFGLAAGTVCTWRGAICSSGVRLGCACARAAAGASRAAIRRAPAAPVERGIMLVSGLAGAGLHHARRQGGIMAKGTGRGRGGRLRPPRPARAAKAALRPHFRPVPDRNAIGRRGQIDAAHRLAAVSGRPGDAARQGFFGRLNPGWSWPWPGAICPPNGRCFGFLFLSAFGFFFSRLFFCSRLAMASSSPSSQSGARTIAWKGAPESSGSRSVTGGQSTPLAPETGRRSILCVGQLLALERGHVACAAMRTIVVAHGRPHIGPGSVAAFANVIVLE